MELIQILGGRILVVAAHADDEVLGAGGTLTQAIRLGASAHVVILSTDSLSRNVDDEKKAYLKKRRIDAANEAAKFGGWSLSLYDYPDNSFDTVSHLNITKLIEKEITAFKPSVLITHFPGDINKDHQIIASAAVTASRPYSAFFPPTILFFEIPSSTHWGFGLPNNSFTPSLWVSLSVDDLTAKTHAIGIYADELRQAPHPRSVEGIQIQARYRGSEIGTDMAEAFVIARTITRVSAI